MVELGETRHDKGRFNYECPRWLWMGGGLGDESSVTPSKRFPVSERAHLRLLSVRGAGTSGRGRLICAVGGGIGIGSVSVEPCCALGCVEPC
jgi:hypothetical protein